ncbi:MAG: hypothetical protein CBC24_05960 [Candidatus Pelagibacter sp. TMED64]|nr:hypothetical protein [Candidatus Pelagibacter sp.]OUU65094.1 MAG: hypothetical protein CBC24_05960 [Candidatus Pelagibacter sp. TMED64]|tara:strand:+ start:10602 stop:10823 length:222 start_codon:yes stop_codon:yes gene_type:complete
MHKQLKFIEPVQIEMDFNVPFTFKDSIAKISRKNPMRGSILQSLLGDVCQNKKSSFTDWVLDAKEEEQEQEDI